jgi:hypothetical protein
MARRERLLRAKLKLPQGLIERTEAQPTGRSAKELMSPTLSPDSKTQVLRLSALAQDDKKDRTPNKIAAPTVARAAVASRREAGNLAPDEVRRGTRRTQSGESNPIARKPRRGDRNPRTKSARSLRP